MKLFADLTPLRESPAFRRLWAGTTLSSVGGAMTMFAVTLQVYDITRSPVGFLGLVILVPLLVVGLPGGTLIDAVDTRRLVLGCTLAIMALSAAFTAQAWLGLHQVGVLYALMAAESAVSAVSVPARRSLTPALLRAGQLAAGLALQRITFQLMLIAGPALAGAIVAAPHLGLRGCYLIDTASSVAALYGTGRLPGDNSKKLRGTAELPDAEKTKKSPINPNGPRLPRSWPASPSSGGPRCLPGRFSPISRPPSSGCRPRCSRRSTRSASAATRGRSGSSAPRSASAAWSPPCSRDR